MVSLGNEGRCVYPWETQIIPLEQIHSHSKARTSTLALVGSVQDAAKARVVAVQTRVVQTYAKCQSKALDVVTTAKAKGVEISDKAKQAAKETVNLWLLSNIKKGNIKNPQEMPEN